MELEKVPEDCQEFIDELQEFLHSTQDILFGLPFHKLWATKSWKRLSNAQQKVYDIAMSYIEQKNKEIKEEDKRSIEVGDDYEAPDHVDFLTYMMHAGKMSPEEITANALDLMAAGVDTVRFVYTVIPRIDRTWSINLSLSKLRAIIEGALYSRVRFISNHHWLNKQMPS